MQKIKIQKGITLIALVITIIVMLILVGVSVTVALNRGLFSTAKEAADGTQIAVDAEKTLDNGRVKVDGIWYDSMEDYINKKPSENQSEGPTEGGDTEVTLPTGWTVAETKPEGWSENVTAVTDGTNIIPLPNGFEMSSEDGESTVTTGLVISDTNNNEFVWIPVTEELGSSYSYSSGYSEPTELTDTYSASGAAYDSQATLDYLYGTDYYNYEEDFNYEEEYAEMVTSVNKYDGFYIGRYETTIDSEGNIGSEYNTEVLTSSSILKKGNNMKNNESYYYRWWGLYYAQKNANVSGNGETVQTAMIYGVLWDKTMDYIREQKAAGNTTYDVDTATATWHGSANGHTGVVNSAQANEGDVALNIWDLESNAWEWTQEAYSTNGRAFRGYYYYRSESASNRLVINYDTFKPTADGGYRSSRVALCVK